VRVQPPPDLVARDAKAREQLVRRQRGVVAGGVGDGPVQTSGFAQEDGADFLRAERDDDVEGVVTDDRKRPSRAGFPSQRRDPIGGQRGDGGGSDGA